MANEFTVTAAEVAAIAAILAPTITALIHSIKEYKISCMAHTLDEKVKICSRFSHCYTRCKANTENMAYCFDLYETTMSLIPLCKKRKTRKKLFQIANVIMNRGASDMTDSLYEECLKMIASEL